MTLHRNAKILLTVFMVSLLVRLAFFSLMFAQGDPATWESASPDVSDYCSSARLIVSDLEFESVGVQTFGPGYPLFLALMHLLSGSSLVVMMLTQIVVSAFVSVLLAWWALRLTDDRRVAWLTALLNAFSFTAISLANIFLSETLFMALVVGGSLLLLSAMNRSQCWLAVLAGLLFGLAVLTRSMGVGLPVVVLSLAFSANFTRLAQRLRVGGVSLFATVALVFAWGTIFSVDSSPTTGAVPSAMFRLVRAVDADRQMISIDAAARQFESDCLRHAYDSTGDYLASHRHLSKLRFSSLLSNEKHLILLVILRNLRDNITNEFGTIAVQIPSLAPAYETTRIFFAKKGLNYRVLLFALIGAVILLVRRQWKICLPLLLIFCYFAVMSGFSDSQTSRIFYPAQMAWGILVSVALLAMYDRVMKRWSGRGQRLTS